MATGLRVTSSTLSHSDSSHFPDTVLGFAPGEVSEPGSSQSDGLSAAEIALSAYTVAVEQKSHDPFLLEMSPLTDVADYFIIASATSERHAQGIADNIERTLGKLGERAATVVGYEDGSWIILDYGNVVVHVFHEPVRQFYDLDGLWRQARRIPPPVELEPQLKRLRTGMYL